ncbi:MAG: class I SAM-dependent methyltransferase [Verrucomicrobiaceae bacterium]|nr:class I SAM-dependent methyltransferase [Verrucomicrobiaceae bacterium]
MAKKILIFAPCTKWIVHHQLDCAIGAALANRGCEVKVMRCDGLFEQCHVAGSPVQANACDSCKTMGAEWFSRFNLPVVQIAALVTPEERAEIKAWVAGIDYANYTKLTFRQWPVGSWMIWNMHSTFRAGQIDFTRPEVQERARHYAEHAALIALATSRQLAAFPADHAISYSGSTSYYRVFFEMCQEAGIRVLTHERGFTDGSFVFFDNLTAYQRNFETQPAWLDQWRQTPLAEDQWQRVAKLFNAREQGTGMNFQSVHQFRSDIARTRARLRLPADAKVLLVLASGDWEFGMFRSYGGLGVIWPTQLEWLQDTARHCAERGWHLVVRHHPLGAGKKTYSRASEFLASLIAHQGEWGSKVRVVMPAENLSTYDLMSLADAAVNQFTTGGAEALIRGVPVVCVAASAYRHMGMDWVRDRADYTAALDRAMSQQPPLNVDALKNAFRYANFHFYTMGSTNLTSMGIKNAYEPDFRLASPKDLQPGIDPVMDRVCTHILEGGPLYPAPEPVTSDADELRLLGAYRDQLVLQREAARASEPALSRPEVTVWLLGEALKRGQTEFPPPDGWRCRHAEVKLDWMVLDARGGADALRLTLGKTAADVNSPYVLVHAPHVTLDESAISQAVDLLELPENKDKTGVLFGCYVIEEKAPHTLGPEWNTATFAPDPAQLPPANIPCLAEPMNVLSLVLWRRDRLGEWLEHSLPRHDNDGTWCRDMLASFLDGKDFVNLAEPVVFIRSGPSQDELLAQAESLVHKGDLDGALKIAASCQERFGFTHGLRGRMAAWLASQQRTAQAVALLNGEYHNGNPDDSCWQTLSQSLPQLALKRPGYKDYASAVESVFGYMVPGQERFLHEKVLSLPSDARILEIGAFFGRSTVAMAFACTGTRRHLFTIDTFSGNEGLMGRTSWFYNHWRGNLRRWGLESYVTSMPGFSHPVVRSLAADEMFDFAFIDASHEYEDVLLDFELVWPHVKPGGWIAFHDVEPGWPGCWRVWEQTGKRLLTDHAACDTLACGRKPADTPWRSCEEEWPGYIASITDYYIAHPKWSQTGHAMRALVEGKATAADDATLAAPPEELLKLLTRSTREENDPWLHEVLARMFATSDPEASARHRAEAARLGASAPTRP